MRAARRRFRKELPHSSFGLSGLQARQDGSNRMNLDAVVAPDGLSARSRVIFSDHHGEQYILHSGSKKYHMYSLVFSKIDIF